MPTYQYSCTACEHAFEQFQTFSEDALSVCPQCEGRLRKVYNAVGVVFKGSGFYRNDSRTGTADGPSANNGSADGAATAKPGADSSPATKPSSGEGGSTTSSSKDAKAAAASSTTAGAGSSSAA